MIVLVFFTMVSCEKPCHAINIKITKERIVKDKFKMHFPPEKGKMD